MSGSAYRGALAFVVLTGLTLALGACGSDSKEPGPKQGASTNALRCEPGQPRACPCLGGGNGMQSCDASGASFSACTGCPIAMSGGRAGTAGTSAAGQGGVPRSGAGGAAGSGAGGTGRAAGGGAGTAGQGGAGGMGGGLASHPGKPTPLPATKGVSCGVGLPVQCQPDMEKCCKRSLSIDSCEAVATACECDEQDCSTIDVRCDGPEDCPSGQLCCGSDGSSSSGGGSGRSRSPGAVRYTAFACAASCSNAERQACHGMADCPSQLTCAINQVLASISTCTNPASLEQ